MDAVDVVAHYLSTDSFNSHKQLQEILTVVGNDKRIMKSHVQRVQRVQTAGTAGLMAIG
jgi:hypothetical protein